MKNKESVKKEALDKIHELFNEAKLIFNKDSNLSNKYVNIARKIAMKYTISVPRELKRQYCKHCYSYLVPGKNCRVRIQKHRVIYYCEKCKKFMRFVLK
jgi:ribonuclease P protein subunit RPR2